MFAVRAVDDAVARLVCPPTVKTPEVVRLVVEALASVVCPVAESVLVVRAPVTALVAERLVDVLFVDEAFVATRFVVVRFVVVAFVAVRSVNNPVRDVRNDVVKFVEKRLVAVSAVAEAVASVV